MECRAAARHRRATAQQVMINGEVEIEMERVLQQWVAEGRATAPAEDMAEEAVTAR